MKKIMKENACSKKVHEAMMKWKTETNKEQTMKRVSWILLIQKGFGWQMNETEQKAR